MEKMNDMKIKVFSQVVSNPWTTPAKINILIWIIHSFTASLIEIHMDKIELNSVYLFSSPTFLLMMGNELLPRSVLCLLSSLIRYLFEKIISFSLSCLKLNQIFFRLCTIFPFPSSGCVSQAVIRAVTVTALRFSLNFSLSWWNM